MNNERPPTASEIELYRLLERANLLIYYSAFLGKGGDDVAQLHDASEAEFMEIASLVGMAAKPLHIRRLQKALSDWKRNPAEFRQPLPSGTSIASAMAIAAASRRRSSTVAGTASSSSSTATSTAHTVTPSNIKTEYIWPQYQNEGFPIATTSSSITTSMPQINYHQFTAPPPLQAGIVGLPGGFGRTDWRPMDGSVAGSQTGQSVGQYDIQGSGFLDTLFMPYTMQGMQGTQMSAFTQQQQQQQQNQQHPNQQNSAVNPSFLPSLGALPTSTATATSTPAHKKDALPRVIPVKGIPVSLLPNAVLKSDEIARIRSCSNVMIQGLPEFPPKRPSRETKTTETIKSLLALLPGDIHWETEVRRFSAIYGRFNAPRKTGRPMSHHEVAVNEAAAQLSLRMPSLLTRRENLYPIARQVVKLSDTAKNAGIDFDNPAQSAHAEHGLFPGPSNDINQLDEWKILAPNQSSSELLALQSKLDTLKREMADMIEEQERLRLSFRTAKSSGVSTLVSDVQKQITALCGSQQRKLEELAGVLITHRMVVKCPDVNFVESFETCVKKEDPSFSSDTECFKTEEEDLFPLNDETYSGSYAETCGEKADS